MNAPGSQMNGGTALHAAAAGDHSVHSTQVDCEQEICLGRAQSADWEVDKEDGVEICSK